MANNIQIDVIPDRVCGVKNLSSSYVRRKRDSSLRSE
jgi:hypothetical protein